MHLSGVQVLDGIRQRCNDIVSNGIASFQKCFDNNNQNVSIVRYSWAANDNRLHVGKAAEVQQVIR